MRNMSTTRPQGGQSRVGWGGIREPGSLCHWVIRHCANPEELAPADKTPSPQGYSTRIVSRDTPYGPSAMEADWFHGTQPREMPADDIEETISSGDGPSCHVDIQWLSCHEQVFLAPILLFSGNGGTVRCSEKQSRYGAWDCL